MSQLRPVVLALALGVMGCSTIGGVQEAAPDAGQYQQFAGSVAEVSEAAARALPDHGFHTTSTSKEGDSALVIIATRGMSFSSYGEIVRIRLVRGDSATTRVWMHTKRRMATNIFANNDWSKAIFAQMQEGLGARMALAANYRLLLVDGDIRVFDIHLVPGDTTPYHSHDAATLFIPSAVARTEGQVSGGPWGDPGPEDASRFQPGTVLSDTVYSTQPVTHRVTNVGAGPFRVIEVTNGGPGVAPGGPTVAHNFPGVVEASSSWFLQGRLALAPGAGTGWSTSSAALVLVQPGAGSVSVEKASAGALPGLLKAPGDWNYIPSGTRYRLRNAGEGPTAVVLIQVR